MGSRSAPRDQQDISGRRPVSVFHDRRQYRMAEDSDEAEDRIPPRKESALASKDKHFRTKAIHRSFASTPAGARSPPAHPRPASQLASRRRPRLHILVVLRSKRQTPVLSAARRSRIELHMSVVGEACAPGSI
jgi:hypothetical protein